MENITCGDGNHEWYIEFFTSGEDTSLKLISEGKYANCIISLYFVLWENTIIIFNFCQMLIIL